MSRPYFRTKTSVLQLEDFLLASKKSPQEVYEIVLEESGGPLQSTSISQEPRNLKQIQNRKNALNKTNKNNSPQSDILEILLQAQRSPTSIVKTVTVTGESVIAFAYTKKQMIDIEQFCCQFHNASVLGVDTKFNLCDLWITDTAYRNKRILNAENGDNLVHLGPIMLHFTKDSATFGRLALEMLSINSKLKSIRSIGVDLEAAIFNGFKSMIPNLGRLLCVRHLMKRDESKLCELLPKTNRNIADKKKSSSEIIATAASASERGGAS